MKIAKFILLLFLFSFLMSFNPFSPEAKLERAENEVIGTFAKKLKSEKNLILIGMGGMISGYSNHIETINLCFSSREELNLEQARKLLIDCSEKFLNSVNSSQKLRPYLLHYPFPAKNISFSIMFEKPVGEWIPSPHIACANISKGKIRYDIRPKTSTLTTLHLESYDEALKMLDVGSLHSETPSSELIK